MRERLISPNFDFFSRPQSAQSSRVFFNQKLFTPCPGRLRGAISESGFTHGSLKSQSLKQRESGDKWQNPRVLGRALQRED